MPLHSFGISWEPSLPPLELSFPLDQKIRISPSFRLSKIRTFGPGREHNIVWAGFGESVC